MHFPLWPDYTGAWNIVHFQKCHLWFRAVQYDGWFVFSKLHNHYICSETAGAHLLIPTVIQSDQSYCRSTIEKIKEIQDQSFSSCSYQNGKKKIDLSDFHQGRVVGATRSGLNIS